jgi:hypothetical protein
MVEELTIDGDTGCDDVGRALRGQYPVYTQDESRTIPTVSSAAVHRNWRNDLLL